MEKILLDFYRHKAIIEVKKLIPDEQEKLQKIIRCRWVDGTNLSEFNPSETCTTYFLHCDIRLSEKSEREIEAIFHDPEEIHDYITYSTSTLPYPQCYVVDIQTFIANDIKPISDKELDDLWNSD